MDKFNDYAGELETTARGLIDAGQANMQSYYNPYRVLLDIYDLKKEYKKSLDLLTALQKDYPNDAGLNARIEQLKQQVATQTVAVPKDSSK
jgi:hypothetical protein